MIVVRLTGGLGNQMFQYANARSYQRSKEEKIALDTRYLKDLDQDIEKQWNKPFALHIFKNLKAEQANESLHKLLTRKNPFYYLRRKIFTLNVTNVFQKGMDPVPFKKIETKYIYLGGNFQSENYFKNIRAELLDEYQFPDLDEKNESVRQQILQVPNSLSVHIRRGDYLASSNQSIFLSVNQDYYKNAIDALFAVTGLTRFDTFVFTDDIEWAKLNFKHPGLSLNFIEGNYGPDSWKDMYLISCCQHHIIANSSFSWWGAWLSQKGGLKMAPRYWFRPNTHQYDIHTIIPESWKVIDYHLT